MNPERDTNEIFAAGRFDWRRVRGDFPATERLAYLNSAGIGPVPRPVAEAAAGFYREQSEEGDKRWPEWVARRERVRERVAAFINAEPDEVAFTTNTSTGMNLIVDALEDRGGVVSCELEFPVSTLPWMHRGVRVELVKAADGELRTEDLFGAASSSGAATICLSHVQFSNGFRADLGEIGSNKGRLNFVVNASQSAGVLPIDVKRMRIDALCAGGHKWLLAGFGSGFVYLSRALLGGTRPRAASWMSVEEPFEMRNDRILPRPDAAARAEIGVPHFAGVFALGAAVEYLQAVGHERIEARALALNRVLTENLRGAGWQILSPLRVEAHRSAETLVATPDPPRTVRELARRGVAVTVKPQGIRVSTHFFNDESDIDRLAGALGEVRQELRREGVA